MNTMTPDPVSSAPTNPSPQPQASRQEEVNISVPCGANATASGSANVTLSEQEVVLKMPKDILVQLGELSELLGVDPSDALRYAIASTKDLYRQRERGAQIVLERGNKRYEVEWVNPNQFRKSLLKHK